MISQKEHLKAKKAYGDKPAFKKRYTSDSSFSKDKDEKRSFEAASAVIPALMTGNANHSADRGEA